MSTVESTRSFVVKSAGNDHECVVLHPVDESVFVGDSWRPVTGEIRSQHLRLADAGVGVPHGVFDQGVDPLEDLSIGAYPVQVLLLCLVGECPDQSGSTRSRGAKRPASAWLMLASKCRALAGGRSRYMVSCQASHSASLTSTALPAREVIRTWSASALTSSMRRSNRFRASLAEIAVTSTHRPFSTATTNSPHPAAPAMGQRPNICNQAAGVCGANTKFESRTLTIVSLPAAL
jgi:hypothetical protein